MNRMRRVPLYFILTFCVFASCGRKGSTVSAPEPSPSPTSSVPVESIVAPSAPTSDFAEVAQSIRPAVIIVSVFDETGHLSANGHGFFVSGDGKFIADRSVMAGGVNAVAKAADSAIYNVSGALAQTPAQNLVLLKADTTRASPFLALSATALPDIAALTDSRGAFTLSAPVAGDYTIQCVADGHAPQSITVSVGSGQRVEVRCRLES